MILIIKIEKLFIYNIKRFLNKLINYLDLMILGNRVSIKKSK
jgi:hypothetical protein